jgi:hypothetical protein
VSRHGGTAWQESDSAVTNPGGMGITAWAGGRRLSAGSRAVGLKASTDLGAARATAASPVVCVGQRRGVVRLTLGSGGG